MPISKNYIEPQDEPSIIDRSDRETPIRIESRRCVEGLDKLTALIDQLEDRLEPIRFKSPINKMAEESAPGASPLTMDLRSYADAIRGLHVRIGTLLEELEI